MPDWGFKTPKVKVSERRPARCGATAYQGMRKKRESLSAQPTHTPLLGRATPTPHSPPLLPHPGPSSQHPSSVGTPVLPHSTTRRRTACIPPTTRLLLHFSSHGPCYDRHGIQCLNKCPGSAWTGCTTNTGRPPVQDSDRCSTSSC